MSELVGKELVPELRFPEFLSSGAWREYELGACLSRHPEYGINAPAVPYSDSLPTYLRITDISESGNFLQKQQVSVAKKVTEKNYLIDNDIVLARTGASVGKSYKYESIDGRLVFAGFLIRVRPNEEKLNSEFLFQFLSTEQYWRWVDFSSARSGQPGINSNEYASLPVPLPRDLKEQKKTAECLSSIDELIATHNHKNEVLKAHKKGLMQQLFPIESEALPKQRFPEFQSAEEWAEIKLGDITSFSSGGTPSKSVPEYWDGDIPWISASSMHETSINKSDHNITQFAVDKGARIVPKGTLLLLVRGSMLHKRIPVGITELDVAFNQDVKALKLKKDILERFLLCLFIASEQRLLGAVTKTGIGAGKLDTADLNDFLVRVPVSKKEQQKIADCLSSVDDLIIAQAQKIESLKLHKKGLMQQLFPSTDEVSS